MALNTHAHEVVPVEALVPSFWCLDGFNVVHLAGQAWTVGVDSCLTLPPAGLQLRFACLLPRLRVSEGSVLGVVLGPLLVVPFVVLLAEVLGLACLGFLPLCFHYGLAVWAVAPAVGYQAFAPGAGFYKGHGLRLLGYKKKNRTALSSSSQYHFINFLYAIQ